MDVKTAYEWLRTHSRESALLESATALLYWDQRTYIPPKGHAHRTAQVTFLAGEMHKRAIDPKRGKALDICESSGLMDDPLSPEAVNLREWRRVYDRAVKIPTSLAMELAQATSQAETTWEKARPANDWDSFKPHLEAIIQLKRREAEALGYEKEPYDALLDGFEPGETAAALEPVFTQLRQAIVPLLERIRDSREKPGNDLSSLTFPVAAQESFGRLVAKALGYDFDAGRMDVTAHPFSTSIGPGDSRITTRYNESDFGQALFGTVHETGHALYEQGLNPEHWGSPMGEAVSLGIHESQSRLWENFVARTPEFWNHFFPKAISLFPGLADISPEDFLFCLNTVEPSLIRVEADEVTYNLHILLRFELELALLRGDLAVDDLPGAWNEKMQAYLGVTPPDAASGVMQDVHWPAGLVGYFPTYTLGNLYAAQFFQAAEKELGPQAALFAQGEFAPLLGWLRNNIHSQGMRLRAHDLAKDATGEDLNPTYLIRYLETKYSAQYGI